MHEVTVEAIGKIRAMRKKDFEHFGWRWSDRNAAWRKLVWAAKLTLLLHVPRLLNWSHVLVVQAMRSSSHFVKALGLGSLGALGK